MAWDDELDYDFRGKLLQVLGKIEERQAAHTRAFEVHERQEDRRFEDGFKTVFASIAALEKVVEKRLVNLETRVDKIEGVTASTRQEALTETKAKLVLQQTRGHEWIKAIVVLVITTLLTIAGTLIVSRLIGG